MYEIGKAKKYILTSEQCLHNLCDLSTNFVLILDQDLRVVFVNEAYLRFSHILKDDIAGKRIESLKLDIFASSDVLSLLNQYRGEGVEHHQLELEVNNTHHIYSITLAKIRFALNKLAIAIIAQDITTKNKVEENMHFLAALVASSEDGIIGVGLDKTIISWNSGAEKIFGLRNDEIVGKNISNIFPPETEAMHLEILNKVLTGEINVLNQTHPLSRNGIAIDISYTISPIKKDDRHIIGLSMMIKDISDLKSKEKALIRSKKKVNILSSITRHDILNQLQALDAFSDLIRPFIQNEPKAQEYLNCLNACSNNIKQHIHFSREYQDIGDNVPVWQSIEKMVKIAAIDNLPPSMSFSINAQNYEIFADPMLMLAFYNLMENSKQHGKHVTHLVISLQPDSTGGGVLVFEDDGIGIPNTEKSLIFEKGYGKNHGLGLFLVREILDITGLEIKETGKEKSGARFEITIPHQALRYKKP